MKTSHVAKPLLFRFDIGSFSLTQYQNEKIIRLLVRQFRSDSVEANGD